MSASSSVPPAAGGGLTVVTHVHNTPQPAAVQHGPDATSSRQRRVLGLGVVEVMVGVMVFLFGWAMVYQADTLGVYSGVFVWGAFSYVAAGATAIASASSSSRCLVNGALVTNILASLFSCTASVMYSLDGAGVMIYCYDGSSWGSTCSVYMSRMQGFSGVLAVFNVLEFIVSIFVASSVKQCCAAAPPQAAQVIVYSNNIPAASMIPQAPPPLQAPPTAYYNSERQKPPEYTSS